MRRRHKNEPRPKRKQDSFEFDSDLYDDYSEFDSDFDDLSDLAADFYSTEWEDPSRPKRKLSARRRIERRNDLKDLLAEFGNWDDIDRSDEWWD